MPTIQGKIVKAFEPRSGQNDRGKWMAQDFLLESYDQPYPRKCVFSVWGEERLIQFNIKEGDDVAVDIDLDARERNGRYYNSVRAWRVVRITPPQMEQMPPTGQPLPPPQAPSAAPIGEAADNDAPSIGPLPPPGDPLGGDATEDLPF